MNDPLIYYRINLINWREMRLLRHQRRFYYCTILMLISVAFMVWSIQQHVDREWLQLQRQQLSLQQNMQQDENKIEQLNEINQQYQVVVERLVVLERLRSERNKLTELMNLIATLVPEGVYVDHLSIDDQNVTLKGISDNTASLATMLSRFEQASQQPPLSAPSSLLSHVQIHSIVHAQSRLNKTVQSFHISFDFQLSLSVAEE